MAHQFILFGFITVFAIVGVYSLVQSRAASYNPIYLSYARQNNISGGSKYSLTNDNIDGFSEKPIYDFSAEEPIFCIQTYPPPEGCNETTGSVVIKVDTNGEVQFGIVRTADMVSVKNCYVLRPVDGEAVVQLRGVNFTKEIKLKEGNGYREHCAGSKDKSQKVLPDYHVKVTKGTVNLFYLASHYAKIPSE